jgi:predicted cupin superfamily sugar epimerase
MRALGGGTTEYPDIQFSAMLTAAEIRKRLKLQPHPAEGGYFAETYRSEHQVAQAALPSGYPGDRSVSTAIYYMLTPDSFSAMHRLRGDEIFHFYLGDPVELLQLRGDGVCEVITLGQDIAAGMHLQHVVPAGAWQGSRLVQGGKYALLGTTVAPGFDFQDFEVGDRGKLLAEYPQNARLIRTLTR